MADCRVAGLHEYCFSQGENGLLTLVYDQSNRADGGVALSKFSIRLSEVFQLFFILFGGRYRTDHLQMVLPPVLVTEISKKSPFSFTRLRIAILRAEIGEW
jgi:hypothetical protein